MNQHYLNTGCLTLALVTVAILLTPSTLVLSHPATVSQQLTRLSKLSFWCGVDRESLRRRGKCHRQYGQCNKE